MSVLKAAGEWEVLTVNELDDECFATRRLRTGGFTSGLAARCIVLANSAIAARWQARLETAKLSIRRLHKITQIR